MYEEVRSQHGDWTPCEEKPDGDQDAANGVGQHHEEGTRVHQAVHVPQGDGREPPTYKPRDDGGWYQEQIPCRLPSRAS